MRMSANPRKSARVNQWIDMVLWTVVDRCAVDTCAVAGVLQWCSQVIDGRCGSRMSGALFGAVL